MVIVYKKRQNFYEKKFMMRFGILDICIKHLAIFFKIPVWTLNTLYVESNYNYFKIYKFIYYLEVWRKKKLLPSNNIRLNYLIEFKSGIHYHYFPNDLINL